MRPEEQFLGRVAHELRNALAPLRNALAALQRPGLGEDARVRAFALMSRQLDQMGRIADALGDVSRAGRGRVELRRERVGLAGLVEAAVARVRPLLEQRGHELLVEMPAEPLHVYADGERTTQVVQQLLDNAAKYTTTPGRVWLSAAREDGDVVIRVRDNGVGIGRERLARIFDLYAGEDAATDRPGGLGVGLAIARGVVLSQDGALSAASDGPGLGSVFTLRLPAEPGRPAARPAAAEAPTAAVHARVLVVDDSRDVQESVADMLRSEGCEVQTASSGQEAIDLVERWQPQVVFVDLHMPVMNGIEVARRLRSRFPPSALRLIMMGGMARNEVLERSAKSAGFDAFVDKMADPEHWVRLLAPPGA